MFVCEMLAPQQGIHVWCTGEWILSENQTMSTIKKAVFVAVMMSAAVAVSACRREVPEPNGLGAKDIAVTKSIN